MSVLMVASLVVRGYGEVASVCRRALPLAVGSLCEAAEPSTSAPFCPKDLFLTRRCKSSKNWWSTNSVRSVHHDHQQCGDKGHGHQHVGARRLLTLEDVEKACWSCDKRVKRGGLVCNGCETIQPPDESLNYFDLFSLGDSFDLDPQLLERRYKQLQWNLHPDKMGHKPPEEQEFSAQQASTVNLAYSILKSPLARANYLLALRGISAGDNFEGTIEDPELLMEVMEAREEVEATDDPRTLSSLLARNRAQQDSLVARLAAAFRNNDMTAAVGLTNQLQYLSKLEHEIVKKLPELPLTA